PQSIAAQSKAIPNRRNGRTPAIKPANNARLCGRLRTLIPSGHQRHRKKLSRAPRVPAVEQSAGQLRQTRMREYRVERAGTTQAPPADQIPLARAATSHQERSEAHKAGLRTIERATRIPRARATAH